MNRQDWDKSKKQMRRLLEQGIEELKDLATEASYMTDATSNVVKLEMEVYSLRNKLEKAQSRLGREIARTASTEGMIKHSSTIKKLIMEIRKMEAAITQDEVKIKKVPLSWSAAKAAANKKRGKPKKATTSSKGASRRKAAREKASAAGKRISKPQMKRF